MKLNCLFLFLFGTNANSLAQNLDTIHWRPDYNLKWEDFQGPHGPWVAAAASSISYEITHVGTNFYFKTCAIFFKKKSYVDTLQTNIYTLAHEQGHFDICEYYSTKLLAALKSAYLNSSNVEYETKKLSSEFETEKRKADELYDFETLHGTNFVKQEEWNKKIAKMLNKTAK